MEEGRELIVTTTVKNTSKHQYGGAQFRKFTQNNKNHVTLIELNFCGSKMYTGAREKTCQSITISMETKIISSFKINPEPNKPSWTWSNLNKFELKGGVIFDFHKRKMEVFSSSQTNFTNRNQGCFIKAPPLTLVEDFSYTW